MRLAAFASLLALVACNGSTSTTDLAGATDAGTTDARALADLAGQSGGPPDLTSGPPVDFAFAIGASVLQHHLHATRDGLYSDPTITRAAAATTHADPNFHASIKGPVYAQPLFIDAHGAPGDDTLVVVTEEDSVIALNAATGAQRWMKTLGTPVTQAQLQCGNIDTVGITGTPVIDPASNTVYLDALNTPDGGVTKQHLVFALSLVDGAVRPGFPVDVNAVAKFGSATFDSTHQLQRGALALVAGVVYVPFGGYFGDCPSYHGWVVGIDPSTNPPRVSAWASGAEGGPIWGPSGLASDGTSIFATTGNTAGTKTWAGGEAIFRFSAGPVFSNQTDDYFAPTNWLDLDNEDLDLGGSGVLLVHLSGNTPSELAVALGKDGNAYVVDRAHLGGIGKPLAQALVSTNELIGAPATYTTPMGTFIVTKGPGAKCPKAPGDLMALTLTPGTPPTIATAWCATINGFGSPMVTTTDGTNESIVWAVGAEIDNKLRAFDAETGAVIFKGGGANEQLGLARRYLAPIAAKGAIYAASDTKIIRFVMP